VSHDKRDESGWLAPAHHVRRQLPSSPPDDVWEDDVKTKKLAALGLVGVLALAACGSDDDGGDGAETDEGGESSALAAPPEDTEATLRVWLNGPDTPDEMIELAKTEFAEAYPNVTVEVERQEWDGLVNRLDTVLPTEDSPDIFEVGNTQAQSYEAAGAMVDLTDFKGDLGGDDLVDSLVEAGTYDGQFYGVPYYGGARIVVYRKDLFEKAGLEIPTTLDEFVEAGKALQADNADVPNFSGIYFPGRNWQAMLSFIWDAGGDIAVNEDGEWVGELSSDDTIAGLETVQDIMQNANSAPADTDDAEDFLAFCNGEVGMLMGPGWKMGQITGEDGCPGKYDSVLGAFALPGSDGGVAPSFLGGSNLGISSQSEQQGLALEFLKVLTSETYQTEFAAIGLIPVRKSLLGEVQGDEAAQAQAEAAEVTRFVPSSENWADVEGGNILHDMGTAISGGADVQDEATRAEDSILEILNG
jgi:N,N'-diacetylchitobiose transport system substrate-binding protein